VGALVTLAIIQARLGSTRFPRKVLADLGGQTVIQRVYARAKEIKGVDYVIVAAPSLADAKAMPVPRGHAQAPDCAIAETDVLGRFALLATWCQPDTIIRLSGDCPCLDPVIAAQVLQLYHASGGDYAWNVAPGYVDGEDVEVFSAALLAVANRQATDAYDREHVTPWMRRHVRVETWPPTPGRAAGKTSIDTPEDLARVRVILQGEQR